jgi:sortase B
MKRNAERKRKAVTGLRLLFAICFLASVAAVAVLCRMEYGESKKEEELKAIHDRDRETEEAGSETEMAERSWPSPSFFTLSGRNKDYLGWLKVYGTGIDLPVVLCEDNDYYLNHDFDGEESSYGTLFADCLTDREDSGNLLIYGHHMKNGTMFGSLEKFMDDTFFQENGQVYWEQADGIYPGEVFALLVVPGYEDEADYLPVRDYQGEVSEEEQQEILETLKSRALQWKEVDFQEEDRILFLMTCDYTRKNGRMLLCVRCETENKNEY